MGARDPVATIRADGLQSVASRRGARAAVVTPGRADQQVSSQGDGVVSRVLELEDASSIGEGGCTRDAPEPGAGPAGHAAIEKARPAHPVGMLVQIEKLVSIDYR